MTRIGIDSWSGAALSFARRTGMALLALLITACGGGGGGSASPGVITSENFEIPAGEQTIPGGGLEILLSAERLRNNL